jgi:chemotaxis protein methyltransferase CheR
MRAQITPGFSDVGDVSDDAFERLRSIVLRECGVVLGPSKRPLLRCRLQPRLRTLGISSYDAYADMLDRGDPDRQELAELLDRITTNQTHFFRERTHIDYFAGEFMDDLEKTGSPRTLRGWCAACSTGQEQASLVMAFLDRTRSQPAWDVRIMGTDISFRALNRAKEAAYTQAELEGIPVPMRKRFLEPVPGGARLAQDIRKRTEFARLNLLRSTYPMRRDLDFVFCRNVMIYFDAPTRAALIRRLVSHIRPNGFLAIGIAEALVERIPGLSQVMTSLYRKAP